MTEEKKNSNWGGARKGAGRRPALGADGTPRKMRSLRASDGEWEMIKAFAKAIKDDPERAKRMMKTE